MSIVISGSGTITGITAGGLPDATITQAEIGTNVAGTGPAFSAYGSTTPTIANNTWTKCVFNTERYDTANCFDSSTNYRFTPNISGYYQVNGQAYVYPGANAVYCAIYKNGSQYVNIAIANNSQGPSALVTTQLYLNGTTDYIECYVYQNSGGGLTGGFPDFNACLVRAA